MDEFKTKGEKREDKAYKAWNGSRQGVRTSTLRAGEGLVKLVVERSMPKPPKKRKK
jgi:hypothetical protein